LSGILGESESQVAGAELDLDTRPTFISILSNSFNTYVPFTKCPFGPISDSVPQTAHQLVFRQYSASYFSDTANFSPPASRGFGYLNHRELDGQ
jgi:hypothetical protein